ncbi:MAG: sigma-70 family RNA polymerase sigma factor, partial [Planctomycetes bacterium]|nr:sigma-70 family RNA polymerase sigma factor [Planctomycetota bacterium]
MGTRDTHPASHRLDGARDPGAEDRSDDALVRAFQRGDARAFDDLVVRHSARVYRLVTRVTGRADVADDVCQEVFVAVHRALPRYEARARFTTWLTSVALNHSRTWARREKRFQSGRTLATEERDPLEQTADPGEGGGPDRLAERADRIRSLRSALERLDEADREIIVLKDLEGMEYGRIAESLEIPRGTVKSRLHRARCALRTILE